MGVVIRSMAWLCGRARGSGQPHARVGPVPVTRHEEVCLCVRVVVVAVVLAVDLAVAVVVVGTVFVSPRSGDEVFEGPVELHDDDVHVDVEEVVVRAAGSGWDCVVVSGGVGIA